MLEEITILLVEDEAIIRLVTERKLQQFGYTVVTAHDGMSAIAAARDNPSIGLILMDIDLGDGIDGTEAASQILEIRTLPIVFHTSHAEREMVNRVRNITRYGYVLKDTGDFVLQSSIEMALDLFRAHLAQQEATKAHRESESRYRSLFENRHTPMLVVDAETTQIVEANQAACEFYGYDHARLTSMNIYQINTMDPKEIKAEIERARLDHRNHFIFRHRLASGEIRTVEVHSGPIKYGGRTLLHSIITDVTARQEAEEALVRSEWIYRTLFENIPTGIVHFNEMGVITEANLAFASIAGRSRESIIGLDILTLPDQRIVPYFKKALEGKPSLYRGKYRTITKQKDIFVRVLIVPLPEGSSFSGGIAMVEDLTEERQRENERSMIESRLRDEQRLSSVGTLADGVAHEINNPLMAMINLAQLIADHKDENAELANEIIKEGERIASIVRGLMSFSSSDRYSRPEAITVTSLIEGVTTLTGEIIRHANIELSVEIPSDLPKITCRPQQIRQILLNLLTNARDAITSARVMRSFSGRIRLACSPCKINTLDAICFTIEDNGDGIPDQSITRVFDPFFTTKSERRGPGLGLSVSWGIAREHGGTLTVAPAQTGGTVFTLTLPVSKNGLTKTENR